MIKIGIDIIEVDRIDKILKRNIFFLSKCFSEKEIEQLRLKRILCQHVASRFCAKEAFFKCVGLKISKIEELKMISIINLESGQPIIILNGELKEKYKHLNFSVSMSHCSKFACSSVVCQ